MWTWRRRDHDAVASCREVGRVLQSYLDCSLDEITLRRVHQHLEACRRCGLDAEVYTELKGSLARHAAPADPSTVARLEEFGRSLTDPSAAADHPAC